MFALDYGVAPPAHDELHEDEVHHAVEPAYAR